MIKQLMFLVSWAAAGSMAWAQEATPPAPGTTPPPTPADSADVQRGLMRTDALRLLSEADQLMADSKNDLAFERLVTLKQKFMSVLDVEEVTTVDRLFEQARSSLGLQVLSDGRVLPMTKDEDIDGLLMILPGSYETEPSAASEASPALRYSAARVLIDGLSNAIYFEVARADDPASPFRQGILSFVRIGGGGGGGGGGGALKMRVLDISNPPLREALVGMWAAPEVFPSFSITNLSINTELDVTRAEDGSAYIAKTERAMPTLAGGAVQSTSRMQVTSDGIWVNDRGLDASGSVVWGSAGADDPGTHLRKTTPSVKVTRKPDGLVILDLIQGEAGGAGGAGGYELSPGGQIALHFSQWTTDGLRLDSSRNGTRGPAVVRYPVGSIAGLDIGLAGITKGTRRRVVIPPVLAYGAQGRPPVPPNATVVFDFEAMWLQPPQEPPPVVVPEGGAAEEPAGPSAAPAKPE